MSACALFIIGTHERRPRRVAPDSSTGQARARFHSPNAARAASIAPARCHRPYEGERTRRESLQLKPLQASRDRSPPRCPRSRGGPYRRWRRAAQHLREILHRRHGRIVVILTDQRDDLGPPRRDLVRRKDRMHDDVGKDLRMARDRLPGRCRPATERAGSHWCQRYAASVELVRDRLSRTRRRSTIDGPRHEVREARQISGSNTVPAGTPRGR